MATFDELVIAYDKSIDWDARLGREMPFILKTIGAPTNRRVLDMACGSGHHSVELADLGCIVDAFDMSSVMIEAAKKLAKDRGVKVSFAIDDMLKISERYHDSYDLILCLGNSLALVPSFHDIEKVTTTVANLISEKGVFVAQTLNFDEIIASEFDKFEPKKATLESGEEVIFSRHFDHSEGNDEYTTLVLSSKLKQNNEWNENISYQKVLRLNHPVLMTILEKSGFNQIEFYSSYSGQPFDPLSSRNMVVRAKIF